MFLLGVMFLAATALAQPTVYVARSFERYPYVYLGESIPKIAIVRAEEAIDKPKELKIVPEAPLLDPVPDEKVVEFKSEESKEEDEHKDEKKEGDDWKGDDKWKGDDEWKEDESKKDELERKSEEERKEEVLIEEAPLKEESEEDKKVIVQIEDPKPPKFFSSIISALPFKFPTFELPFKLPSFWKPKEKTIIIPYFYNYDGRKAYVVAE